MILSVFPNCVSNKVISSLTSWIILEIETRLTSINFSDEYILKIVRSLDINKGHNHDMSVRMVKTCDDATKKRLFIIYKNCIKIVLLTQYTEKV